MRAKPSVYVRSRLVNLSFLRAVFSVIQVSSQISITLQLKFYAVFGIIARPRLEIVGPILDHDRIEQQCNPNSMDLTICRKILLFVSGGNSLLLIGYNVN